MQFTHPHVYAFPLGRSALGRSVFGQLLLAMLLLNGCGVSAQGANVSPVFPTERHEELMEELSYQQEAEEEEEEEPTEDTASWWDNISYENWEINLSSTTSLIILGLLLLGLGWFIFRILGDVEMRKRTRSKQEEQQDKISLDELEEEQLIAEGVSLSLLERAEQSGQYDIAVRLLYLQLLKELQDGGLIKYRRDFSNRDYQNQLAKAPFLSDFRTVTADYERYWYGKYPLERLGYRIVYQKFNALQAAINPTTAKSTSYV